MADQASTNVLKLEKPSKRRLRADRTAKEKARKKGVALSRRHYFEILPVELLAHILSYVPTPKDVLAVTRCNKHLCATLLNKAQRYIWKRAREECSIPMSGPPPGWSEAAYVAFVFDGGVCEVCGKHSTKRYASYALRARLCGADECTRTFSRERLVIEPEAPNVRPYIEKWIPRLEESTLLDPGIPTTLICRKTDWEAAIEEYNRTLVMTGSIEQMAKKHGKEERLMLAMTAHYRELCKFSQAWEKAYKVAKQTNDSTMTAIAEKEGWTVKNMLDSPTCRAFHTGFSNSLQVYTEKDFGIIRSQVIAEMDPTVDRHRRRKAEAELLTRQTDIERHHQRIKSSGAYGLVPTLAEFRKLPTMKAMVDKDTASIDEELRRSDLIAALLRDNLKKWLDDARTGLAKLLGVVNYKNASTKVLHPAERVTARFLCVTCGNKAVSLDFAGVCKHECQKMSRGALKAPWTAERFVADTKAIDVAVQAAKLAEIDAGDLDAAKRLDDIGPRFQCDSCDSRIYMNFRCLAAHSKRHESMTISLLSVEEARSKNICAFQSGALAKYTANNVESKGLRSLDRFVCRHCPIPKTLLVRRTINGPVPAIPPVAVLPTPTQPSESTIAPNPPATLASVPNVVPEKPKSGEQIMDHSDGTIKQSYPKGVFSFDGMVSHVMSKHSATSVGDEDFFPIINHGMP